MEVNKYAGDANLRAGKHEHFLEKKDVAIRGYCCDFSLTPKQNELLV